MKPHAWNFPLNLVAAFFLAACAASGAAAMNVYLYPDYKGPLGNPANPAANSQITCQPNGNVYDSREHVIGTLIDASGRSVTDMNANGSYRVRALDGKVIGTTEPPSPTTGVRTLSLQATGSGGQPLVAQNAASGNNPATDDNGTTAATGSAISHDIRGSVGSPNKTDDNTSTGVSSRPDPNNQPGPSGPVVSNGNATAVNPGTAGGHPVDPSTTNSVPASMESGNR